MARRIKLRGDRLNKIKKPKMIKAKETNIADDFKVLSDREHVRLRSVL